MTTEVVEIVEETILSVVEEVVTIIEVAAQGPPGASGAAGSYAHTQASASNVWNVAHSLGYKPAGHQLWDSAGTEWTNFRVVHIDDDALEIHMDFSFSGNSFHS